MRALVFALFIGIGGISALTAAREPPAQRGGGQATIPAAVRAANSRFAGVWKLVGEDTRDANGQTVARGPDAGDAATGAVSGTSCTTRPAT